MEKILEGDIFESAENKANLSMLERGEDVPANMYIEAEAVKSRNGELFFEFGKNVGVITADEISLLGQPRNCIFLVNRSVGFYVTDKKEENGVVTYNLSRKKVQKDYYDETIKNIKPMDILDGKIYTVQPASAYVDIGYGILTVVHIAYASIVRHQTLVGFFSIGERIKVLVTKGVTEEDPFIYVTHKELLGTWEDNVAQFEVGDVVVGQISTITDYGIFVALKPNLAVLSDIPSDFDTAGLKPGMFVSVHIKGIRPEVGKIKAKINTAVPARESDIMSRKVYYLDYPYAEKGNRWIYNECVTLESKRIVTEFDEK